MLSAKAVGPTTYLRVLRQYMRLRRVLARASSDFHKIGQRADRSKVYRTVLLSGDIYVRHDEMCNDNLLKRLAKNGMRIIVEPNIILFEYMAFNHSHIP